MYDSKPKINIESSQLPNNYNPNLSNYNNYIKKQTELIVNYQNDSTIKYHEFIFDIAEDFNNNVKIKQLKLQKYIKIFQNYTNDLSKISSNLDIVTTYHKQFIKRNEDDN